MPSFSTRRRVRHSAGDMFALVADVEAYPRFLPLCEGLTVKSRERKAAGDGEILIADMTVGYKAFRETFRSRVDLKPLGEQGVPQIDVSYLDGPFRYLENRWRFLPAEAGGSGGSGGSGAAGSIVDFYIAYEFKTPILSLLMGAMFDRAFRKFSEAFETRADAVYGRRPA